VLVVSRCDSELLVLVFCGLSVLLRLLRFCVMWLSLIGIVVCLIGMLVLLCIVGLCV